MYIVLKKIITALAVVAIVIDIFLGAFGIAYYITEQADGVEDNYFKIEQTYELAQKNHQDLIIIKHQLKIGDYNAVN